MYSMLPTLKSLIVIGLCDIAVLALSSVLYVCYRRVTKLDLRVFKVSSLPSDRVNYLLIPLPIVISSLRQWLNVKPKTSFMPLSMGCRLKQTRGRRIFSKPVKTLASSMP